MASLAQQTISVVKNCVAGLADLAIPDVCAACSRGDAQANHLCSECNIKLLSLVSLDYCRRCGSSLGQNVPDRPDGCWACPTELPRFGRVIRLAPYAQPLSGLIRQFKYHRGDVIAARLAVLLAEAVAARADEPFDLVTPVPMHWWRRMRRGFDHASNLARSLGRQLDLPVGGELIRIRNTPPQIHLSRTKRIANVRGAFKVACPAVIEGAKVLLVDDVTTTGATASEAARTLLAGGASQVTLAVLAKSEPPVAYGARAAD